MKDKISKLFFLVDRRENSAKNGSEGDNRLRSLVFFAVQAMEGIQKTLYCHQ